MNSIIRSEELNLKHAKQTLLYVTNNFSQVELALLSTIGSKFDFLIYNNNPLKDYNLATDYLLPSNVKIASDAKSVVMLAGVFTAAITTVGHLSPVLDAKILTVLRACVAINIPIIEVPHGLYQLGYNLSDDSTFINTASHSLGAGYPVPSFADHQLSWFDNSNIGYPRNRNESIKKAASAVVPTFTVITTNTNWYLYNYQDQRVLAQSIFELARNNPGKLYIWAPHPAELNTQNLIHYMLGAKPKNLLRYGHDKEIYFHSIDTTEDLIRHASEGISTVSTCLLEYEMYNIPVTIFSNDALKTVTSTLQSASLFCSPEELIYNKPELLKTGQLHKFSVEGFDLAISRILAGPQHRNPLRNLVMNV